jgi:hypothetical protein
MPEMSDKHHFEPTLVIGLVLLSCHNIAINKDKRSERRQSHEDIY